MARRRSWGKARHRTDLLGLRRPAHTRWPLRLTLGTLTAVLIGLAALVGGLVAVAKVFASAPSIAPPLSGPQPQSHVPFTVANNGRFTLYGVTLRCGVAGIVWGSDARLHEVGVQDRGSTVGDIQSHDQREFDCPMNVQGVTEAHFWVEALWKLHLLGVIPWTQRQRYAFELKSLPDGRPYWQPGR